MDGTTGQALPWNPNAADYVYTLAMNGSTVMAGGRFNSIGGINQRFIVGLDLTTGQPTNFNPDINGSVTAMASDGTNIYLFGGFNRFAGAPREYGAAFNIATGQATNFNPPREVNGIASYKGIAVDASRVYVGGDFLGFRVPKPGGITVGVGRSNLAAFDKVTGGLTSWDPGATSRVGALAINNGIIYVGGEFGAVGGQPRNGVAAIAADANGSVTSWNPGGNRNNGNVEAKSFAFSEKTVYVAGAFERMDDQPRNGFAEVNLETGRVTPWDANATIIPGLAGGGSALLLSNNTLYVGGIFSSIGGQTRKNVAALDATTGQATSFQADVDLGTALAGAFPGINSLVIFGNSGRFTVSRLYVGGKYDNIVSSGHSNIAGVVLAGLR